MDTYVLLKTLYMLAMPPASLGLALVLGLMLGLFGWPRLARWLVALAIVETLVMSFPPVADAMIRYLEDQARAAELAAPHCCFDAIVVLGGGLSPASPPEREFPRLVNGADRVWLAARLYHRKVAPRIIVSGGGYMAEPGVPSTSEAAAMRQFLIDLGVPAEAIVDEAASLNTIENIRNVHAIVGSGRVALITSAYHMPRALHLAALAKLDAAAFPTDYRSLRSTRPLWENWIFSGDALELSVIALREIVGTRLDVRARALEAGALGQ
jgi:uncharacterized SAM-binding protein YcdF (DUF218 family)